MTEKKRFKVCPAGRRSGKTERAKRNLVIQALSVKGLYFAAAPTYTQVKKIYWRDLKALIHPAWMAKRPSETELTLYFKNGSEISLIGLDKPERFEGIPWTGGVIDEIADVKSNAWAENISPALDTEGLDTWVWLIGVPDGLNHFYEMAEYAQTDDEEWGLYTWHSADILSPSKIAAAKRRLDPRTFRQEYEASFETATGRVYDDYSNDNHTDREFKPGTIIWTHDFNFMPLSSAIIQTDGGRVFVVDEIVLEHAVARQTAEEFVERYKGHERCPVIIYGDASGRVGEKHGHWSDYSEIQQILQKAGFSVTLRVPKSNPAIRDGQNATRGLILNAAGERRLFVNPKKAPTVDRGLKTVQKKEGSTFIEDETNTSQHITTAIRYYAAVEFPVYGKPTLRIR